MEDPTQPTETREYTTLKELVPQFRLAVQPNLVTLSGHLLAKGLITDEEEAELRNDSKSKANRAADLVSMMMNKVKLDPIYFKKCIDALKSSGVQDIDNLITPLELEPQAKPRTYMSKRMSPAAEVSDYSNTGTQTVSTNQTQHTLVMECKCHICTSVLKHTSTIINFPMLNADEEDFALQLKRQTKGIMMEFHGVESGLYNTVCDTIPIERLKFHLNAVKASQSEQFEESVFKDYEDQIQAATNTHTILCVICKFWSFIDYDLLEHLIKFLGNEDDKKRMSNYHEKFDQYAKRRIIECPSIEPTDDDKKWENVYIKLDSKLESITINELREFRFKVSEIMCTSVSAIHFCCVERGCIQVMWQIPHFIKQIIFPLSPEKENMLEQLGVTQFSCLDYEYTAPNMNQQVSVSNGLETPFKSDSIGRMTPVSDSEEYQHKLAYYGTESQRCESYGNINLHCSDVPMDGDTTNQTKSSPTEESDRVDHFPSGMVEATELSGGIILSQQLITGQRTDHLDIRARPELLTKLEVAQKIAYKEESFSNLLCDVQRYLQRNCTDVDVQDIKVYLTSLSVSIREDANPLTFTPHQAEIIEHNQLPQIFQWLTINGFWSFLNFYLLESLVERYGNDDLKRSVAEFKEGMERFKQEMKLVDFLPAWSGRCPHVPASGFEPIILRVNKDWPNCTLADIARLEGYLESRFLINRFILRFANSHPGSVVIMWLVPSHVIAFLKKRIMAVGIKSLSEVGIVEVAFSDNLIRIKASSIGVQPKPYTPTRSKGFKTLLDCGEFDELYATSIRDPEFFWGTLAKQFLQWDKPFKKVMDCNMEEGEIKWFTHGKLNVSVNCVDRYAIKHPDRVALIWEKNEWQGEVERVTYKELLEKVCQITNVFESKGVKKGDTVAICMPVCPLAVASMLACARIGAVHSVMFTSFAMVKEKQIQTQLLKERIAGAKVIISSNTFPLSATGKVLPLKQTLDDVILASSDVNIQHVLVFKRTDADVAMKPGRDEWLEEAMERQPKECEPESMDSEDDLFVMFTSGVTGSPKGIVHSQAGYLLHVAVTHKYYFNYQPGEIFSPALPISAGLPDTATWSTDHSAMELQQCFLIAQLLILVHLTTGK